MSAHTPTPWHCTYGGTPLRAKRIASKDDQIANCVGSQSMFNAAHIVLCVNAHHALDAALRNALSLNPDADLLFESHALLAELEAA